MGRLCPLQPISVDWILLLLGLLLVGGVTWCVFGGGSLWVPPYPF